MSHPVIQHVSLEVAAEVGDVTVAFWALLGFDRVDPPVSLADRAAFLQGGPAQIHLIWAGGDVAPARGHVAVVVEDYEGTVAALRAAGHEGDPRAEHWGSPRAYVRDPADNLVELMDFAPPPPALGGSAGP